MTLTGQQHTAGRWKQPELLEHIHVGLNR